MIVIIAVLIAAPMLVLFPLVLLNSGLRSADREADPLSSVVVARPGTDGGLTCRVKVKNPSTQVVLVSLGAKRSSPLAILTLAPHDRRHATLSDRKRSESLFDRHVGSVEANDEGYWDLPLVAPMARRPSAVTVEVLVTAGGDRMLRHVHRLSLRPNDRLPSPLA